ncbi:MAG: hypothetical protein AAF235_03390 [Planctomycetota bacterium]
MPGWLIALCIFGGIIAAVLVVLWLLDGTDPLRRFLRWLSWWL